MKRLTGTVAGRNRGCHSNPFGWIHSGKATVAHDQKARFKHSVARFVVSCQVSYCPNLRKDIYFGGISFRIAVTVASARNSISRFPSETAFGVAISIPFTVVSFAFMRSGMRTSSGLMTSETTA